MTEVPDSNREEKDRIRSEITAISNRDMVAIVLRESLGALPVIGPGLTELINVGIPNSAFNRLVDFTIDLRGDLTRLEGRLNQEYLRTDAAAFMVKEIIIQVRDNYQREKLDALRGAFLNLKPAGNGFVDPASLGTRTWNHWSRIRTGHDTLQS